MKVKKLIEILNPFVEKDIDVILDNYKISDIISPSLTYDLCSVGIEEQKEGNIVIKLGFKSQDIKLDDKKPSSRMKNMNISVLKGSSLNKGGNNE